MPPYILRITKYKVPDCKLEDLYTFACVQEKYTQKRADKQFEIVYTQNENFMENQKGLKAYTQHTRTNREQYMS